MSAKNPVSIAVHNITQVNAEYSTAKDHHWVTLTFGSRVDLELILFFDDPALARQVAQALRPRESLAAELDDAIPY